MKIEFRQSGGFDGLVRRCDIDTETLPAIEAAEIEDLVKNTGVLKSKSILSRIVAFKPVGGCDTLHYRISVKSSEVTYRISFDDFTIPEEGRPLLEYLKKRARPQRA
jgi:hypothetical protein